MMGAAASEDSALHLALDLVALYADIPTTARLHAVHRAVQARRVSASAYHALRRCVRRWRAVALASARSARSARNARRRVNSWRTGRRFDENAPLFCFAA